MEGNSPLSGSPALTQHSDVKETLGAQVSEDSAGVRRLNQYAMKQLLGSGSYGNVYEGFDNERHIKVAIKQFSKARLRRNLQTKRGVAGVALRGRMRGRINNAHHVKSASRDDDALGNSIASSISTNSTTSSSSSSSSSSEESPIELVRGELAILKKLDHKNVVKLYEVLDSDEDSLFMVFECCELGPVMKFSLDKHLTPCSTQHCRNVLRQAILGVEYLHEHDIAHRDIKPDNLLMTADGTVKIVDFGVSEMFSTKGEDRSNKPSGSPAFFSPELCIAHHGEVSAKSADIWALGVTIYCMMFGKLPFHGDTILDLYENIRSGILEFPANSDELVIDLLSKMLEKDPVQRIEMEKLRIHPWVTEDGTLPLLSKAENCTGMVTQVTEIEVEQAIKKLVNVFTVLKAVHHFKRSLGNLHSTSSENLMKAGGD